MTKFEASAPYDMADLSGDSPKLKFDWKTFDISFEDYFYSKNHQDQTNAPEIEKLFELIYAEVARKCDEDGTYTVMCHKGRYKVVRTDEIEQIMYDDLSDEEKDNYNAKRLQDEMAEKRSARNLLLAETDKFMIADYPIEDDERELYKAYRQYLRNLPSADGFPEVEILTFEQWNNTNGEGA